MKTVHKAAKPLEELNDVTLFELPTDAEVLSVGNQHEKLCVWYTTDTDCRRTRLWPLRVAGTGHPLELDCDGPLGRFLATVQFSSGRLVFHVWFMLG